MLGDLSRFDQRCFDFRPKILQLSGLLTRFDPRKIDGI